MKKTIRRSLPRGNRGRGIDFSKEPVRNVPKKVDHKRGSKTAKQRGDIITKVESEK